MAKAVFLTPEQTTSQAWRDLLDARAREMVQALETLGVEVLSVPVEEMVNRPDAADEAIDRFGPDFITAATFNYFLTATLSRDDLLDRPVPLVALWDDPLGAVANYATRKVWFWEREELESAGRVEDDEDHGGLPLTPPELFRQLMDRPNLVHVGWDSGHIQAVHDLRLARPCNVHWFPVATYKPFLRMGERAARLAPVRDVAFCGNTYIRFLDQRHLGEPVAALVADVCTRKLQSLDRSVWDLLVSAVGRLPTALRRESGLAVHQRPFWDLYLLLAWYALNTRVRLPILNSIQRPVDVFGLFADPESAALLRAYPNLRYRGIADHSVALPEVYATTRVNICVSNGLIYGGVPSKLIDCLASGGFALCDAKQDLVRLFGRDVEEVFFRNGEELDEKIAYFLERPRRRREIAAALRERIGRECTTERLFEQVLEIVKGMRTGAGAPTDPSPFRWHNDGDRGIDQSLSAQAASPR